MHSGAAGLRYRLMNRRSLFLMLGALALARPARAGVSLQALSAYLNSFRTVRGRFTQFNANGSRSTGIYMIKKPGFVRFVYDPPLKSAVVADGTWIGVIDGKSNDGAKRYPLSKSPLSVLLRDRIDLENSRLLRDFREVGGSSFVTLQDPQEPRAGRLTLVFDSKPLVLRQWIVEDEAGRETGFQLDSMETGMPLARRLFSIESTALKLQGPRRGPDSK